MKLMTLVQSFYCNPLHAAYNEDFCGVVDNLSVLANAGLQTETGQGYMAAICQETGACALTFLGSTCVADFKAFFIDNDANEDIFSNKMKEALGVAESAAGWTPEMIEGANTVFDYYKNLINNNDDANLCSALEAITF